MILQYFCYLMQRAYLLEMAPKLEKIEGKRRRGRQRMRLLDTITNSMDMSLSTLRKIEDRGVWPAAVHGALGVCRLHGPFRTTVLQALPGIGLSVAQRLFVSTLPSSILSFLSPIAVAQVKSVLLF